MNLDDLSANLKMINFWHGKQPGVSISYSLKGNAKTSNEYYAEIAAFTERWLSENRPGLASRINLILTDRKANRLAPRSLDEIMLELLALGVAIREYVPRAEAVPNGVISLLQALITQEELHPALDGLFKALRGLINGIFCPIRVKRSGRPYSIQRVEKLVAWLKVAGAEAQALRFSEWIDLFNRAGSAVTSDLIAASLELADKFEMES
jgi:hypothetical protein